MMENRKKSKVRRRCWVPNCPNNTRCNDKGAYVSKMKLFIFPRDVGRCVKWLRAIGDPKLAENYHTVTTCKFVCCEHFLPNHITPQGRCAFNAVPQIFKDQRPPLLQEYVERFLTTVPPERQHEVEAMRIEEDASTMNVVDITTAPHDTSALKTVSGGQEDNTSGQTDGSIVQNAPVCALQTTPGPHDAYVVESDIKVLPQTTPKHLDAGRTADSQILSFLNNAKGRNQVRKGAVPSINFPVSDCPSAPVNVGWRCVVPDCEKTLDDGVSLHHFPSSARRRRAWALVCCLTKMPTARTRICSNHFVEKDFTITGNSKTLKRYCAIPSRNLPATTNEEDDEEWEHTSISSASLSDLETSFDEDDEEQREFVLFDADSNVFPNKQKHVHRVSEPQKHISTQDAVSEIKNCLSDLLILQERTNFFNRLLELVTLHSSNGHTDSHLSAVPCDSSRQTDDLDYYPKLTILNLFDNNEDFSILTGVSFTSLNYLCILISKFCSDSGKCKVPLKIRIVLALCKLRLNLSYGCLGLLFGIDRCLCATYFASSISMLANVLRCAIYLPAKEEDLMNMPKCFEKFRDTRIVLDCIEIPVDSLDCLKCSSCLYSQHKNQFTVKFLVGTTPSGLISFLSEVYGGRASHKNIFESDLLAKNMLEPCSDAIMVDKDFCIHNVCDLYNFKIHCPWCVVNKQVQTNIEQVSAKVYVERVIQRMKIFKILQSRLSWSTLPYINDIVTVIAGLVNLSSPIFSSEKFLTQRDS